MPVQDELATILGPDERDAVHSLRARVQREAEQIAAGDGSDTTRERFTGSSTSTAARCEPERLRATGGWRSSSSTRAGAEAFARQLVA